MSDLFQDKNIKPMLIGAESGPFDDDAFIYELKVDGERCVAYLDPAAETDLRNKRNMKMLPKVPELAGLHQNVNRRCILDGELAVITDGRPDFYAIQSRSIMPTPYKIQLAAQRQPASFVAFDILYLEDGPTVGLPLIERKRLLRDVVREENARFAVSRVVEQHGADFYELVKVQNLEGIVAKRRDSRYYFDKRTKDWIKIKYLKDDDFVVCGYARGEGGMNAVVLGQYHGGQIVYKGRVSLSVGGEGFRLIRAQPKVAAPPFGGTGISEHTTWIAPDSKFSNKGELKKKIIEILSPSHSFFNVDSVMLLFLPLTKLLRVDCVTPLIIQSLLSVIPYSSHNSRIRALTAWLIDMGITSIL